MDKNWLIRTKSNHILGPVSKEKIIELYNNGTISAEDEVCSGNGYWFYIREKDLVTKFLLGTELQGFNPLSAALKENVFVQNMTSDLNSSETKALVKSRLTQSTEPMNLPLTEGNTIALQDQRSDSDKKQKIPEKEYNIKQAWIKYAGIIGFIVLFLLVYFRKSIFLEFFSYLHNAPSSLVSSAYGQSQNLILKKKS